MQFFYTRVRDSIAVYSGKSSRLESEDQMTGNANQARGPVKSGNRDISATEDAAESAWPHDEPQAHLGCEGNIDESRDKRRISILSDDQLLTTAQAGDQQAFVELCRRHSPMVKRRIVSIVNNNEDAEDVLQETFLRAYIHLSAFRHTCKFSTWLMSIGINTALMILRKRKTRKEGQTEFLNDESGTWQATEYLEVSPDPESLHARQQIVVLVKRGVQKLRPPLRSIIEQHYGTECSLKESAKALNLSLATVKSRLMRGRKTLRWYLRRRGVLDSGV